MADIPGNIDEIDERISAVRENLRELVEQAAAHSGAADDELTSRRIAEHEEQLDLLMQKRAELEQSALAATDRKAQ